jgi:hypothetical protein
MHRAPAVLVAVAVVLHGATSSHILAQPSPSSRAAAATALASSLYQEWLGATRAFTPVEVDRTVTPDVRTMSVESGVAYELARRYFDHLAGDDEAIADGLAWYLQSRVVEHAFNERFRMPGYRYQTACVFGCRIAWPLPLIVNRSSDGLCRTEYLRLDSGRAWPPVDGRPCAKFDRRRLGAALAFGALERELGWPTLQGALRVLANATSGRAIDILEAATARRLAAVFETASSGPTDHSIAGVTSEPGTCAGTPCVATTVRITRNGVVPFPLRVRLDFDDGTHLDTRWKGELDPLSFESVEPARRVRLDPDRVWLPDRNYANNEYVRAPIADAPAAKWVGYWMVWLQDAMLAFSFPV